MEVAVVVLEFDGFIICVTEAIADRRSVVNGASTRLKLICGHTCKSCFPLKKWANGTGKSSGENPS